MEAAGPTTLFSCPFPKHTKEGITYILTCTQNLCSTETFMGFQKQEHFQNRKT